MKFSKIFSAQNNLLKAHIISVETDISRGLHSFSIVGLANKAVDEARDRVSAAIKNSGFKSPKQTNAKVTVSLAPADIKKEGPAFDLPIALGYLLAAGEINFNTEKKLFVGELALNGTLRPVRGTLSFARIAAEQGFEEIYVPIENVAEAALIKNIAVYGVKNLNEIIGHLDSKIHADDYYKIRRASIINPAKITEKYDTGIDFDDIVGQETAKRGLIIAAAGRHNIAFFGPPGTGKTMLARAFISILPKLTFEEMLEVTEIHSIAGCLEGTLLTQPPVRTPHHTASYIALVGGGNPLKPGEVTLAHRGVLFMDEFPEFDRKVIESLRQPLEDRVISLSRAKGSAIFPADFIFVAALNPCPCGKKGIKDRECSCPPVLIRNYEKKISEPIIDRIDMWIEVSKIEHNQLMRKRIGTIETDLAIEAVTKARNIQRERFARLNMKINSNATIGPRDLKRSTNLSKSAEENLNRAAQTYELSGRGYHRTVKLARTIADIANSETIEAPHILEALQYRQKHLKGVS